jgi:pyruvate dehydrogenase E1 component beta subunit
VFIDDRWLYNLSEHVPEELYSVPIGKGIVRRAGSEITVIAMSYLAHQALMAADTLAAEGIQVEVIDPRTIKPLDIDLIVSSVVKTGRALVVDGGWRTCGYAAEIAAVIGETAFSNLKSPVKRLTLPDIPAPACRSLEQAYYLNSANIVSAVRELLAWES